MKLLVVLLIAISSSSVFANPNFATGENVCVIQLTKGDASGEVPFVSLQCGAKEVLGHEVPSYNTTNDKEGFKASLKSVLVQAMGENITCQEHETEYLWFSLCVRN